MDVNVIFNNAVPIDENRTLLLILKMKKKY